MLTAKKTTVPAKLKPHAKPMLVCSDGSVMVECAGMWFATDKVGQK